MKLSIISLKHHYTQNKGNLHHGTFNNNGMMATLGMRTQSITALSIMTISTTGKNSIFLSVVDHSPEG
jgi:hypothetical protein